MFKMYKEQYTVSELIKMCGDDTINLSPRYQRTGDVWNLKDKQLLIDSIFNGIDLPKFYFHLFPKDDNRKYQYSVIDGKQRILAIFDFYCNKYPLSKGFQFWEENKQLDISGMYYENIASEYPLIAGSFLRFKLDFTVIDSDNIDRINNMFIRINKGVKVNPAEKRNAYGGKLIDYIAESCEKSKFFTETLTIKDERKAYQELYLKMFVLEQEGGVVTLGEKNINTILERHKDCMNDEIRVIDNIYKSLDIISSLFGASEKVFRKNNVILYYWFLKDKLSDGNTVVDFIRHFEKERLNRQIEDSDYQRFNELTRQGMYQGPKMEERLAILEKHYKKWRARE